MKIFMEEKKTHKFELKETMLPLSPNCLKNISGGQNNSGCQIGFFNREEPTFFFIFFDLSLWINHCEQVDKI